MSTQFPQLPIDGLNPWVVTAPEPALTITGHTAVLTNIRFVWSNLRCSWCRRNVALWTDHGTIDAGLKPGRPHDRTQKLTARWYEIYRPATAPPIPPHCPHPGCRPPATWGIPGHEVPVTGWIDGAWRLSADPFTPADHIDLPPLPAHPHTYRLLDKVWSTLRRTHPDLAAAADAYDAQQRHRAEPG